MQKPKRASVKIAESRTVNKRKKINDCM